MRNILLIVFVLSFSIVAKAEWFDIPYSDSKTEVQRAAIAEGLELMKENNESQAFSGTDSSDRTINIIHIFGKNNPEKSLSFFIVDSDSESGIIYNSVLNEILASGRWHLSGTSSGLGFDLSVFKNNSNEELSLGIYEDSVFAVKKP
ncbi:MAG: hypothetical protein HDS80_05760 [Bacteroidales bacterium]|nr:hypothetical protein [Bacteroidales bacterium]